MSVLELFTRDDVNSRLAAVRMKKQLKNHMGRIRARRWFAEIFWNEVLGWFAKD